MKAKNDKKLIYPPLNFNKLLKAEMLKLYNGRCRQHGIRYTEHPNCVYKDDFDLHAGIREKVGFLDIETSNFQPPFGFVICWAIKEYGDDGKLYSAKISTADIEREARSSIKEPVKIDRRVLTEFVKEVRRFDRVVVYWGRNRRFDIPYLRHRCLKLGLNFPTYSEIICVDAYDWVRNFLRLTSNRLGIVCKEFGFPAKIHDMFPAHWVKASAGNQKAIDYIDIHCKEDVLALEPVYNLLLPFARNTKTSV